MGAIQERPNPSKMNRKNSIQYLISQTIKLITIYFQCCKSTSIIYYLKYYTSSPYPYDINRSESKITVGKELIGKQEVIKYGNMCAVMDLIFKYMSICEEYKRDGMMPRFLLFSTRTNNKTLNYNNFSLQKKIFFNRST